MITNYPFKNLVFHGGGVRTFAYHGVLPVLEEYGILSQIERVAGTSAGAMAAALVCFRLSARETIDLFRSLDYSKIPEIKTSVSLVLPQPIEEGLGRVAGLLSALNHIVRNYGMYRTHYPYNWMIETIASHCGGNGRATFADFGRYGFRDLCVMTTNISTHKVVTFSADNTPEVAVVDALLMSQSIPLFFEAPQFDGKNLGSGDYYGDGGILNNYPLHIFDELKYAAGNSWFIGGINWETLGCHLYTPEDAPIPNYRRPISSIASYITNLIEILIEAEIAIYEGDPSARQRTIDISNCGVSVTDFDIKLRPDNPSYVQLVEAGERATREYLAAYRLPQGKSEIYDIPVTTNPSLALA